MCPSSDGRRCDGGLFAETVWDYELHLLDGDSARRVAQVTGSYQRTCCHPFEAATASGLQLTVRVTNGDAHARIFEVRAYG